jgi:F-type H+-transporting ATPase subunit delta
MSATRVAHRYAQALLDLSIENNNLDVVKADMVQLSTVARESRDFTNLLNSPIVDDAKKMDILQAIFGTNMNKVSLDFMSLIVKNEREEMLPIIAATFVDLYKEKNNILDVTVISAVALDDKTRTTIIEKIKTNFNGTIELTEKIDASLVGGFIIRIDDQQIDASIASQISNLKNILLN